MFSYEKVADGVRYTLYFFSGFSGHQHPYTPTGPIAVDDAYSKSRRTFYVGWYADKDGDPQLRQLDKYWLVHTDFPVDETKVGSFPGNHYFRIDRSEGRVVISTQIQPTDTVDLAEFYLCRVNRGGEVEDSYILTRHLMDRYVYSYASNGALDDVEIEAFDIP